jgi:hypothetical protein
MSGETHSSDVHEGGERRSAPVSRQWKDQPHGRQTLTSEPSNDTGDSGLVVVHHQIKMMCWERM